jgi:glyoxylase-like metal-dependent hydrolase (beta-lactamase superfamily II)
MAGRLYFRQLLSGRDFAADDQIAAQMVNFVYLIGDRATHDCVVVDPAYAVEDLLAIAEQDDMRIIGALATHYHADHIGGSMMGYALEGVKDLLERAPVKVHVNDAEAAWVQRQTGLGDSDLAKHESGDRLAVGEIPIQFLHTPGHTPGSQCFLVEDRLVSGDTLFLDGCGRTDLPGSDVDEMWQSLQRLASLPDKIVLYPGHRYSFASSATMAAVRESNFVLRPRTKEQWLSMFGQA